MPDPTHSGSAQRALGVVLSLAVGLTLGACGSDAESVASATTTADGSDAATSGVQVVSAEVAKSHIDSGDPDLVVLDVRTQEEYNESHLANAILIDFYAADFADQIRELDPTVPYVLYCRSGNRTSQTRALMEELNFEEVYDIDGGITAWMSAGFETE